MHKYWVIIQYMNEQNLMIGPYKTLQEVTNQATIWNNEQEGIFSIVPVISPKEFVKMIKKSTLLHIPIGS